jgi:uncharacterized protein YcgL (UPF0745 family)
LQNGLEKLQNLTKVPQNMIDNHKNTKILFLIKLDEMHKLLEEQIDGTMELYRIVNMGFYLMYTASRKVRHHHRKRKLPEIKEVITTGTLELMVLEKNTTEPLVNAKLLLAKLNLTLDVDMDGEVFKGDLEPDTYNASLICEGFEDIYFVFKIEAGKTTAMQFLMVKKEEEKKEAGGTNH